MAKRPKILADHKKRGQTLVPPFTENFGPIQEVSWIKTIMPELLWIALIQYQHGHKRGVELITSLTRIARLIIPSTDLQTFAFASSYSVFSDSKGKRLRESLARTGELPLIQKSLAPLIAWYPNCPHCGLFSEPIATTSPEGLQSIKSALSSLYHRSDRDPMMVQATAVWLMFDADALKVSKGLALAKFPQIEQYPETLLSQKIGSSIRATLNAFFGSENSYSPDYVWPDNFWNHGLEVEPCEFNNE
jgi:hypothetical protein